MLKLKFLPPGNMSIISLNVHKKVMKSILFIIKSIYITVKHSKPDLDWMRTYGEIMLFAVLPISDNCGLCIRSKLTKQVSKCKADWMLSSYQV